MSDYWQQAMKEVEGLVPLCPLRIIRVKDGTVIVQAIFAPQKIADTWGGVAKNAAS